MNSHGQCIHIGVGIELNFEEAVLRVMVRWVVCAGQGSWLNHETAVYNLDGGRPLWGQFGPSPPPFCYSFCP